MNKNYRIGAYEKAFPEQYELGEMLQMAKDTGYDFFEISIDRTDKRISRLYDETYQNYLLEQMKDKDFRIESICLSALTTYTLGNSDPQIEAKAKDIFLHALEFARKLNIPLLQIPACDVPKFDYKDEVTDRRYRSNLKELLKTAEYYDIKIGLENMENDYMDTVEKSMNLLKEMNEPFFQLYSDAGNIYSACKIYGNSWKEDMEKGAGHYHAFHLKETREGKYGGLFYGEGHVDFAGMVKKAWDLGIRQYVLEYWYTGNEAWYSDLKAARDKCARWIEDSQMKEFDFSEEIARAANADVAWSKLDNKNILITGATGLIGKYLIEVLLKRNELKQIKTKIIAVGRNEEKFNQRFAEYKDCHELSFYKHDVQQSFSDLKQKPDVIVHLASNTHPRLYASDPIGTEMANILGTQHLLELAADNPESRFVFASSGDIYGDNRSDKEFLSEDDCGYINCNTLRAGYIEGKRASEALCNAYKEAKGVDFVIARFCRLYGPTMQLSDSKAISQFINKAINGEDIVLKSKGTQTFSYLYIYDAVTALLTVMTKGITGNAYNVADNNEALALKDLAQILSEIGGSKVVFDLPDELENKGASSFQNVKLDGRKLMALNWHREVELAKGLKHTVMSFRKSK